MDTKDAQTTLERLESPEGLNLVQRATKTFLVLRALRGHIDQADASLTRLATERDQSLYALGEAALNDLEGQHPTLDRGAFAQTLTLLRSDLEDLEHKADGAQDRHDAAQARLDEETQTLLTEQEGLENEMDAIETRLRGVPEDAPDRESVIESLAGDMVALKAQRMALRERYAKHIEAKTLQLKLLSKDARESRSAAVHVDSRVRSVIRDLGRSVLALDHPLASSDLARSVQIALQDMARVRKERLLAIDLMDRVDTLPLIHGLLGVLILLGLGITALIWLT